MVRLSLLYLVAATLFGQSIDYIKQVKNKPHLLAASYKTGSLTGGVQEAICALPATGGTVLITENITLTADVNNCARTQVSVHKMPGVAVTGAYSILEQTPDETLTEWSTGPKTMWTRLGMDNYRVAGLSIVPEAHAPFPPSHGNGLAVWQTDKTKIDPDNFFNGISTVIHTNNTMPYENAAVLGFMYSYGGARAWGGDFHSIIPATATSVPNLQVGVQAETETEKSGVAEKYPLLAIHRSASGESATAMMTMWSDAGAGADLLITTDANVFTGEGIVLRLADTTNPTYRAFGLVNDTGASNLWTVQKNGSMFSRGGFSDIVPKTGETSAGWNLYRVGESGAVNTELMNIGADNLYPDSFGIATFKSGTGASRPLIFASDGAEKLRIDSNPGILLGQSTRVRNGSGAPEGVVVGNVGDLYLRTDGGAGSTLYVKEANNGLNTGWAAK